MLSKINDYHQSSREIKTDKKMSIYLIYLNNFFFFFLFEIQEEEGVPLSLC